MTTLTVVRVGLFALTIVALGFVPGVSADSPPSAKGKGDFMVNGAQRTFSFNAITHRNGVVTGRAKVNNRSTGTVIHMTIDCLNFVAPDTVLVSGTIGKSTMSSLVGQTGIFEAQDNGKGRHEARDKRRGGDEADDDGTDSDEADDDGTDSGSQPDRLSLLVPFAAGTLDCNALLDLGLMAIQHGNIKVRP
jgi:hypothetical protein